MCSSQRRLSPQVWLIAMIALAVGALVFKLHMALTTYGTNDVLYWERFLSSIKALGGIGTYHAIWYFNHPPFMVYALRIMDKLASLSGIFFPFWLRLPAIVCDLGSLVLVYRILKAQSGATYSRPALALMAIAPASIMISGFHGNTDSAMIFFLLLSVFLIDRVPFAWLAGIALGMSMNIKVVPLMFMPAFFFYLPCWRKRFEFFGAAAAFVCLSWMPYIAQDPHIIWQRVFGYGGIYGHWGLSRLLFGPQPMYFLWQTYAVVGKYLTLLTVVAIAFWLNRPPRKTPLFLQCGFIAFTFLTLTPGFGVQYLVWLVPWVVALGVLPSLLYLTASGVFLFLVYNFWSQSFPWFLANSDQVGDWRGYIVDFEILCWSSVAVVCIIFLRTLIKARRAESSSRIAAQD